MRNAGDGAPSGTSGRRQRAPGPQAPPRTTGNGGASLFTPAYRASRANSGSYPRDQGPGSGRAGRDESPRGDDWTGQNQPDGGYGQDYDEPGTGYSWAGDDLTTAGHSWSRSELFDPRPPNAIRGFPPAPGDPLPVYPPGPFAAWNRGAPSGGLGGAPADLTAAERRPGGDAGSPRQLTTATISPVEFDTDYSLPAIRDPIPGRDDHAGTEAPARQRQAAAPRDHSRSAGTHGGRARQGSRARSRARGRQAPVRLAIGVAVMLIAAVVLILLSSHGRTPSGGHPSAHGRSRSVAPSASAPAISPPPGRWSYIGARATDTVPLSEAELYPASFVSSGTPYYRAAVNAGNYCRPALIGGALQVAVRHAGCSEQVRGTYLSRVTNVMATIGVFNLASFSAASKAALAAGPAQFVAQLPGKTGPTRAIGGGTGLEEAVVKGHYLILVWAEFIRPQAPKTSAQRQQLTAFMNLLITHTANVSLSNRMVSGKPLPTG